MGVHFLIGEVPLNTMDFQRALTSPQRTQTLIKTLIKRLRVPQPSTRRHVFN